MAPLQLPRPGNAYGAGPLGGAEGAEAEHLLCLVSWDRGSQALPRLSVAPCDLCVVRLQNGQCAYWLEHRL